MPSQKFTTQNQTEHEILMEKPNGTQPMLDICGFDHYTKAKARFFHILRGQIFFISLVSF